MNVQDAIVLVTGGNRGLGKAFVQQLLEAGAKKVYVGSRTPIESSDPRLQVIKLDVTNEQDIRAAAEIAQDVTILINNAGIAYDMPTLVAPSTQIARDLMETNYFGILSMVRAFAPILTKNGGGAIVNILSVLSWVTFPHTTTYSATKAAALLLTDGLRVELRSQGTQVIAVHVAYMDTDMAAHIDPAEKISPDLVAERVIKGINNGQEEVLADEFTKQVKTALANNREGLYQKVQTDWDNMQKNA